MSFQGTLTIEDSTFNVISFEYKAHRDHDRTGRPTSRLHGFRMEIVVEHAPACMFLHEWAYRNHEVHNGRVTFSRRDSLQRQTEIRFSDGYIVSIGTFFTGEGENPMIEKIVICANTFEYETDGHLTMYHGDWPESAS